jgi:hypothetical protein
MAEGNMRLPFICRWFVHFPFDHYTLCYLLSSSQPDTRCMIQDVASQHCGDKRIARCVLCWTTCSWRHSIGIRRKRLFNVHSFILVSPSDQSMYVQIIDIWRVIYIIGSTLIIVICNMHLNRCSWKLYNSVSMLNKQ